MTSFPLVDEFAETLLKGYHRPFHFVEALVETILARSEIFPIKNQVMGCADLGDDAVLETALVGRADYIVTLDKKLLNLRTYVAKYYKQREIAIVTPAAFLGAFRTARTS